jgi:HAD superfamily hydrolase (TIGR01549 family)
MQIAVGFDFDHTLGLDNKLERTVALQMAAGLCAKRGITFDAAAAGAKLDEEIVMVRRGEVPVETAIEGWLQAFAGTGDENAIEAGRFRDEVMARAPEFVRALPGARPLLDALDALGVRYAILSNGWSPLQEEKARLIGFEAPVYVSERIGAWKPSTPAFESLVRLFGLPAADVWYVGDDPEVDCAGAQAAGLTAVWFDAEARAYPAGVAQPEYTIHALEELPGLLQGRLGGAAKTPQ